jgi:hypothetical protein
VTYTPCSLHPSRSFLSARRRLKRSDRYFSELTCGDPFQLYVPQTHLRWIQAAITHPDCRGYSFIEEGMASYFTREQLERKIPLEQVTPWTRKKYRGRIGAGEFFAPGYARAYGIHPESFPWLERRVVLGDVFAGLPSAADAGIEWVLVCDDLRRTAGVGERAMLHGMDRALGLLRERGVRRLHFKLHPAQLGSDQVQTIRSLLAAHAPALRAVELSAEVILEGLARSNPRARFLMGMSSVGLYAALMGREVYSYAHLVAEVAPGMRRHVENLPGVLLERLRFLEEPVAVT